MSKRMAITAKMDLLACIPLSLIRVLRLDQASFTTQPVIRFLHTMGLMLWVWASIWALAMYSIKLLTIDTCKLLPMAPSSLLLRPPSHSSESDAARNTQITQPCLLLLSCNMTCIIPTMSISNDCNRQVVTANLRALLDSQPATLPASNSKRHTLFRTVHK